MEYKKYNDVIKELEQENEEFKLWKNSYDNEKKIIEKIVETRKKLGLSQKDLAAKTGLKQSAISRIENFSHSPQLDTLLQITQGLGINLIVTDSTENIK